MGVVENVVLHVFSVQQGRDPTENKWNPREVGKSTELKMKCFLHFGKVWSADKALVDLGEMKYLL